MLPGPELDREVAAKVFNYAIIIDSATSTASMWHQKTRTYVPIPKYSTVLELGHNVLSEMSKKGWDCKIKSDVGDSIVWKCSFTRRGQPGMEVKGISIPHVICLAALDIANKF